MSYMADTDHTKGVQNLWLTYTIIFLNNLAAKAIKLEESFINGYLSECFESQSAISATRRIRRIVDAKCKKADINKVMAKQHQHLNIKETEILLSLLKKYEERFGGTLGMWNIALVYLELRYNAKPV